MPVSGPQRCKRSPANTRAPTAVAEEKQQPPPSLSNAQSSRGSNKGSSSTIRPALRDLLFPSGKSSSDTGPSQDGHTPLCPHSSFWDRDSRCCCPERDFNRIMQPECAAELLSSKPCLTTSPMPRLSPSWDRNPHPRACSKAPLPAWHHLAAGSARSEARLCRAVSYGHVAGATCAAGCLSLAFGAGQGNPKCSPSHAYDTPTAPGIQRATEKGAQGQRSSQGRR